MGRRKAQCRCSVMEISCSWVENTGALCRTRGVYVLWLTEREKVNCVFSCAFFCASQDRAYLCQEITVCCIFCAALWRELLHKVPKINIFFFFLHLTAKPVYPNCTIFSFPSHFLVPQCYLFPMFYIMMISLFPVLFLLRLSWTWG